jgi:arginase
VARRGYAVGSAVLAAVLPANHGPTAAAPVAMDDAGLELADGIEAKQVILTQLARPSRSSASTTRPGSSP